MLQKAFIETADYRAMANGPAYNAVVGRRRAGKSALFLRLADHFSRVEGVVVLPVKPNASAFVGLAGAVQSALGERTTYEQARELMRHCWQAVFHAHILAKLRDKELPTWSQSSPVDSAFSLVEELKAHSQAYHALVHSAGKCAELLESRVRELLQSLSSRGVVLIDGIDEGWVGADVENGILGGLAAAAADLQDRETGVRLVIFIRDNMYRILGKHDQDFSRILAGDSLRLDWEHESLLELVAARIRQVLELDEDSRSVETWNRLAKHDLSGKAGFRSVLKHTLYRPRDVLELLNTAIQTAQRRGRSDIINQDVEEAAKSISVSRLQDLQKEYAAVLPGLAQQLQAFSGRPAISTIGELRAWLAEQIAEFAGDAALSAAKFGNAAGFLQALFGIGFIGVEESSGAFRFCHDGSDSHLSEISDKTRVAVHPCYHRALDVVWPEGEPLDVLLNSSFEYGEVQSNTREIEALLKKHSRDLVKRLTSIGPGRDHYAAFEEWAKETISTLFSADLKNIALHPCPSGVMRRDIVASIEAVGGPWRRIAESHRAQQAIFEVKNYEQLEPDAYQQLASYMQGDYGTVGFIVYRGQGANPNANERSHLVAQKLLGRTIVLLPESLLQRLLKKEKAKDIQDKFRAWYDNHLRKWSEPNAAAK